jgi:hypothetical protein
LNYDNWSENPVLTSAATTGLPIANLKYPSVTICSQGVIHEILIASLFKEFFNFINAQSKVGQLISQTPIELGKLYLNYAHNLVFLLLHFNFKL